MHFQKVHFKKKCLPHRLLCAQQCVSLLFSLWNTLFLHDSQRIIRIRPSMIAPPLDGGQQHKKSGKDRQTVLDRRDKRVDQTHLVMRGTRLVEGHPVAKQFADKCLRVREKPSTDRVHRIIIFRRNRARGLYDRRQQTHSEQAEPEVGGGHVWSRDWRRTPEDCRSVGRWKLAPLSEVIRRPSAGRCRNYLSSAWSGASAARLYQRSSERERERERERARSLAAGRPKMQDWNMTDKIARLEFGELAMRVRKTLLNEGSCHKH